MTDEHRSEFVGFNELDSIRLNSIRQPHLPAKAAVRAG
jgi:hypothetical protein